jgi:hypothetical protein
MGDFGVLFGSPMFFRSPVFFDVSAFLSPAFFRSPVFFEVAVFFEVPVLFRSPIFFRSPVFFETTPVSLVFAFVVVFKSPVERPVAFEPTLVFALFEGSKTGFDTDTAGCGAETV